LDWRGVGSNAVANAMKSDGNMEKPKSRRRWKRRSSSWSIGGATSETKGRFQGSSVASGS
jgi:hypothetical protein